jgi:hypothetical protein
MEQRHSQFWLKLIAAPLIVFEVDWHVRHLRQELIVVEDGSDGNETERSDSRLKLIVLRDNSERNEMLRKRTGAGIKGVEQIETDVNRRYQQAGFSGNDAGY